MTAKTPRPLTADELRIKASLDALLTHYDRFKPAKLGTEVQVYALPSSCSKFCEKDGIDQLRCRGYVIVPCAPPGGRK